MIDFNVDVAQGYGIYNIENEFEPANYASTINVACGFHAGDPIAIKKAFDFASKHNVAISAHIGFADIQGFGKRKMELSEDELDALVVYQVGALLSFAKTYDLEIENVRCHGALKELLNTSENDAKIIARAIKKVNPWLNLFVSNAQTKEIVQAEGLKAALESDYDPNKTLDDLFEEGVETIHFKKIEDIVEAKKTISQIAPINYNRVQGQI